MTTGPSIEDLLADAELEVGRYDWEGTFADYLRMVTENPRMSRLSHKLVHDAILSEGVEASPTGEPVYKLFDGEIFGLLPTMERIVQYFASAGERTEVRKRILLLLGPPASGKSSIVALIKGALERYTRRDAGAVYTIKGCPMQEEPLHLIPHQLRPQLKEEYGIHIEGDLCPRCRYLLSHRYAGKISRIPITRVVYSEYGAVGIGYYIATNPNPTDASLLVGSIDTSRLEGDRVEVAGKAFRMDGELNVANRGLMEFVEIFKADRHLLTTLLSLAQEQLIKMERFGSVYADEVIVAHSNEGDYRTFTSEEHAEALSDRIISVQIPYNLTVSEEVKIYEKLLKNSALQDLHMSPLTLPVISTFAVLSRLEPPMRQGMSLVDKLRLFDGRTVRHFSDDDVLEMKRHHLDEGMTGLSPRYLMNRLATVASSPDIHCVSPLNALNSLWEGLRENVSLGDTDLVKYIGFVKDSVAEYNDRALRDVQRAYKEGFEQSAADLLAEYLGNLATHLSGGEANERDMRDMEKHVGITDRTRDEFRQETHTYFTNLRERGFAFDFTTEPRLRQAVEAHLFPSSRELQRRLTKPRFAKQRAVWRRERDAVVHRLATSYGYCRSCADDVIDYVVHVLRGAAVLKTPRGEGIEWQWDLNPPPPPVEEPSE